MGTIGYSNDAVAIIAVGGTAQDLTGAWADLGGEIQMQGYRYVGLYLQVDINNSANVRIRLLAKTANAGTVEYPLELKTVGTSDVKVEDHYFELNVDVDQNIMLTWSIDNIIPWGQFQVMAGTVGATAGQIDSALYTLGA
jgi:hypothetical protein